MSEFVVGVIGASPKVSRYSNKAIRLLKHHGYKVIPINSAYDKIEGISVVHELLAVKEKIDTLTMYVGPRHSAAMIDDIILSRPRRVILNPGTESDLLTNSLLPHGIIVQEACTLVLLNTGQFEDNSDQN